MGQQASRASCSEQSSERSRATGHPAGAEGPRCAAYPARANDPLRVVTASCAEKHATAPRLSPFSPQQSHKEQPMVSTDTISPTSEPLVTPNRAAPRDREGRVIATSSRVAAAVMGLSLLATACAQAAPATRAREASASPAKLTGAGDDAIRSFQFHAPDAALVDLRKRLAATRWPEQETVADHSQGVKLATIKELVRYWQSEYDWRKVEARLNALPQFVTTIDGLDIHFIHVRSKQPQALPVIITHGWPGSIIEMLKVIDPLTNPTANGGRAEDAFDVVIPSMPGYGFSGIPQDTSWDPAHIARAWAVLMKRLGYTRYVAQGGDWGSVIVDLMGTQTPPELAGIHTNMAGAVPPDIDHAAQIGAPAPAGLPPEE